MNEVENIIEAMKESCIEISKKVKFENLLKIIKFDVFFFIKAD